MFCVTTAILAERWHRICINIAYCLEICFRAIFLRRLSKFENRGAFISVSLRGMCYVFDCTEALSDKNPLYLTWNIAAIIRWIHQHDFRGACTVQIWIDICIEIHTCIQPLRWINNIVLYSWEQSFVWVELWHKRFVRSILNVVWSPENQIEQYKFDWFDRTLQTKLYCMIHRLKCWSILHAYDEIHFIHLIAKIIVS